MTETVDGYIARVDELGRIVLPKPMRVRLGLEVRSQVLVSTKDHEIRIRAYHPEGDLNASVEILENQIKMLSHDDLGLSSTTATELTALTAKMREVLANSQGGGN